MLLRQRAAGKRGEYEVVHYAAYVMWRVNWVHLLELREALEDAETRVDLARAERLRSEMEALTHELARAVGLGGRERRAGQAAERARTAVQKRLREAIRLIHGAQPELGRHLDQTVRTGLFCGYFPDGRVR